MNIWRGRGKGYRSPLSLVRSPHNIVSGPKRPGKPSRKVILPQTVVPKSLRDKISAWIESLYSRGYQFEERQKFRRGLDYLSSPDSVWWDYVEAVLIHAQFCIDTGMDVSYAEWIRALDQKRYPKVLKKKRLYFADGSLKYKKVATFIDFTIYSVSREWESMESMWEDRPFHPPE